MCVKLSPGCWAFICLHRVMFACLRVISSSSAFVRESVVCLRVSRLHLCSVILPWQIFAISLWFSPLFLFYSFSHAQSIYALSAIQFERVTDFGLTADVYVLFVYIYCMIDIIAATNNQKVDKIYRPLLPPCLSHHRNMMAHRISIQFWEFYLRVNEIFFSSVFVDQIAKNIPTNAYILRCGLMKCYADVDSSTIAN